MNPDYLPDLRLVFSILTAEGLAFWNGTFDDLRAILRFPNSMVSRIWSALLYASDVPEMGVKKPQAARRKGKFAIRVPREYQVPRPAFQRELRLVKWGLQAVEGGYQWSHVGGTDKSAVFEDFDAAIVYASSLKPLNLAVDEPTALCSVFDYVEVTPQARGLLAPAPLPVPLIAFPPEPPELSTLNIPEVTSNAEPTEVSQEPMPLTPENAPIPAGVPVDVAKTMLPWMAWEVVQ